MKKMFEIGDLVHYRENDEKITKSTLGIVTDIDIEKNTYYVNWIDNLYRGQKKVLGHISGCLIPI